MSRAVDEWIGKTDDTPVPPRVRLRVLRAYDNRCYLTGREIRPGDKWELEHKVDLILGGQNRESNLAPALAAPHKRKTAAAMAVKAKIDRLAKKHRGIEPRSSKPFPGGKQSKWKRRMDGTVVPRGRIEREEAS